MPKITLNIDKDTFQRLEVIGINTNTNISETIKNAIKYTKNEWTTVAYQIPRKRLEQYTINELKHKKIIYLLLGEDRFGTSKVYIGQTDIRVPDKNACTRILEQHGNQHFNSDDWEEAFIFTSSTDTWDLDALEHILISDTKTENLWNGNKGHINTFNLTKYDEIIEHIKAYLDTAGYDFYKEKQVQQEIKPERQYKIINLQEPGAIPEIITSDWVVKKMVNMIPKELFNPNTTFFDPACKGGEYLKEIYGLKIRCCRMMNTGKQQKKRSFIVVI